MKEYQGMKIIGIDNGYGNIKTANCCFPAGLTAYDTDPVFKDDLLVYSERYYLIGTGHKEFTADKTEDDDYYILTLAAIARELNVYGLTSSTVRLAVGLPLTWVSQQREDFKAYLMRSRSVDFTFRGKAYQVEIAGIDVFPQGFAAVASQIREFQGVNMLCDIGNGTMNEWYLRDCSRKQCAAYQARGNAGKPTTNHAIYGYRKDPEDKHHWLIDEDAAAVVRRIFHLSMEGHGPHEIASILRDDRIERPSYYMGRRGQGTQHNSYDESRPYDWSGTTVSNILAKPEYMGHTVNFRSYKESYKDKHAIKRSPEEWTVFENTHEAIVDSETWKLAQRIRKTVKRTDTTGTANPLTGLVFCADCGAKMYNHRKKSFSEKEGRGIDPITGLYPYDSYECSTYSLTFNRSQKECASHYIRTRDLRSLLLDTIRTVSAYAITNESEFIEKVRAASEVRQAQAAKDLKRKLNKDRKRSGELNGLIKKLYESYATEKISGKRFELLSGEYEREQEALEESIAKAQAELDAFEADTTRVDQFLALTKKYTDFSVLTTPMIYEFVDKILVHAPDRSTGDRTQEVEIYLKFIGKFDVPLPELTEEELAEMEKQRKQRAYYRERSRRQREREKQRKLDTKEKTA